MPKSKGDINTKAKRRLLRQEEFRERMNFTRSINELNGIQRTLMKSWRYLLPEQVSAMKLRTDIIFRRINKVLPDVKAVEVDLNSTVEVNLNDTESIRQLPRSELQTLIAQLAEGGGESEESGGESTSIH